MKKIVKILLCIVLVACIGWAGYFSYCLHFLLKDDRMSKDSVFEYVTVNQDVLLDSISYMDALSGQYGDKIISVKRGKDIAEITDNKIYLILFNQQYVELNNEDLIEIFSHNEIQYILIEEQYIEFACGGYGMGSGTGYTGFYYSYS